MMGRRDKKQGKPTMESDEYINQLWGWLLEFVEFIIPEADTEDLPAAVEKAIKRLKGECKIEVLMNLELSNYINRNGAIILRSALPDTDPESWPTHWANKFESDITTDIGNDWRDLIQEA